MRALSILLIACGLGGLAHAGTVTLTAQDVNAAQDIEAAIATATKGGAESGRVVLDGRGGVFSLPSEDHIINIGFSNLTLSGINGATFDECAAIELDELPLENLLIEGLRFNCENGGGTNIGGSGTGSGRFTNVTIRNNVLRERTGIFVENGSGWKIYNNTISQTQGDCFEGFAIFLRGGTGNSVVGNNVQGCIELDAAETRDPSDNRIVANRVTSVAGVGIILDRGTRNTVSLNKISVGGPGGAGIYLAEPTTQNSVYLNSVSSPEGAVTAVQDLGTGNKVSRNSP